MGWTEGDGVSYINDMYRTKRKNFESEGANH